MTTVDADRFNGYLLPGEHVLWFDRPGQGIMFSPRDTVLIPFSLLWGGFAIFWETTVLTMKAPGPFALFGVPFVLVGLFFIFGRFLLDAWLRARTAYALTDRRVLILRWGLWPSFQALQMDRMSEATLCEGSNGKGTIRFGAQSPLWGARGASVTAMVASLDPTPQLLAIPDAKAVFTAIQQRVQDARG